MHYHTGVYMAGNEGGHPHLLRTWRRNNTSTYRLPSKRRLARVGERFENEKTGRKLNSPLLHLPSLDTPPQA